MAPGSSSCSRPRATPKPPLRPGPPRSRLIAGAAARGVDAASKWGREDSNLRRLSRRVYSPFPLAARAHPQGAANCSLGRLERFDVIVVGAGPAGSTTAYRLALTRTLAPLVSAGWGAKVALDRFPRLMFSVARLRPLWPVVEKLVSGELRGPSDARGLGRGPVRLLAALAHRSGDPGRPYRAEAAAG